MNRITNQMINNTMSYNLQRHQQEMDRIQNSLATGKNVNVPRDNPIAAAARKATKYWLIVSVLRDDRPLSIRKRSAIGNDSIAAAATSRATRASASTPRYGRR